MKLLLAIGTVDLDSKDKNGRTPLLWVIVYRHEDTGLYSSRAEKKQRRQRQEAVVRLLLAKDGVNPNLKDSNCRTLLSWAAENGHKAMVSLLLAKAGVDPDCKYNYGRTPLSWAAAKRQWEVSQDDEAVVELLLANECVDVNTEDTNWAVEKGNHAAAKLLLVKNGIDPNSKNDPSLTLL